MSREVAAAGEREAVGVWQQVAHQSAVPPQEVDLQPQGAEAERRFPESAGLPGQERLDFRWFPWVSVLPIGEASVFPPSAQNRFRRLRKSRDASQRVSSWRGVS